MSGKHFHRSQSLAKSPLANALIGLLIVFGLWQVIPVLLGIPASVLPTFDAVLSACFRKHDILVPHVFETVEESVAGFLTALILGSSIAIVLAEIQWVRRLAYYPIVALQNIPRVALAPLLVIWFSHGMAPKIAMATLIAFFPIFKGFLDGLEQDRTGLRSTMAVLNPSRMKMLFKIKLPEAVPSALTGCQVGITYATIGAIVGEMAQPSRGLGYLIAQSGDDFDTNMQFAAVLMVSAVGLLLYGIVSLFVYAFLRRFHRPVSLNVEPF